jgi:hypothetical protein
MRQHGRDPNSPRADVPCAVAVDKNDQKASFTGSRSSDPWGETVFYEWEFGDRTGTVIGVRNGTLTQTYSSRGTFTVSSIALIITMSKAIHQRQPVL